MKRAVLAAVLAALVPVAPIVAETDAAETDVAEVDVAETDSVPFTVAVNSPIAYQQPLPGLTAEQRTRFERGRALFNQIWIASPSLDTTVDGLGPTFNQSSCGACHARNGRGAPPAGPQERLRGLLVRLSVPGVAANGAPKPHVVYGEQLQDSAISGVPAEGRAVIQWYERAELFADGTTLTLRRPEVTLKNLAFGDPGKDLLLSPRVAPQIVGAGLLDTVTDAQLDALAALPRPDGISGRVNRVRDPVTGEERNGRFGWKANTASLTAQTTGAFAGDLGITSLHSRWENCPAAQTACAGAAAASPDLTESQLADAVFYQAALAVPARRAADDPQVLEGERLFHTAGCQHCHVPELEGGAGALPALSNRRFAAYTDMLLHDMGAGLADGRPDHLAEGTEWRTPPLWGIGLLNTVNEHETLLHDGRARGVLEAVMWHGGEAEAARERVRNMRATERDALVRFVHSL